MTDLSTSLSLPARLHDLAAAQPSLPWRIGGGGSPQIAAPTAGDRRGSTRAGHEIGRLTSPLHVDGCPNLPFTPRPEQVHYLPKGVTVDVYLSMAGDPRASESRDVAERVRRRTTVAINRIQN